MVQNDSLVCRAVVVQWIPAGGNNAGEEVRSSPAAVGSNRRTFAHASIARPHHLAFVVRLAPPARYATQAAPIATRWQRAARALGHGRLERVSLLCHGRSLVARRRGGRARGRRRRGHGRRLASRGREARLGESYAEGGCALLDGAGANAVFETRSSGLQSPSEEPGSKGGAEEQEAGVEHEAGHQLESVSL